MSRFTKQHYVAIARIIATAKTKEELINMFVGYFKSDNRKFNEKRFRAYIEHLRAGSYG